MSTKAETVREELKKYTSVEEMKTHIEEITKKADCSKALVYKEIGKLSETLSIVEPEAKEPVVKIEKPKEIEAEEIKEIETEESVEPELTETEKELGLEEKPEIVEEEKPEIAEEEKPKVEISVKMVQVIAEKPFELAAKFTGCEDLKLDPKESKEIAEAWLPVLSQYLPDVLEKYFPLIYAGYVTIAVIGSKAYTYRTWKQAKQPEPPQPETVKKIPEPEKQEDLTMEESTKKYAKGFVNKI